MSVFKYSTNPIFVKQENKKRRLEPPFFSLVAMCLSEYSVDHFAFGSDKIFSAFQARIV